ncbi:MAG: ribonuclease P protein component [Candidatus Pacebacteria bacterium]|nr:ribonuclease P protein component [Candidatus Paceibacterota bacterium]MDD4074334.1 ribonuclease P protein component [Candidatus Paceibacterota bacterium]
MLPKENRLKKKKEFETVFKNGKTVRSKNIISKYFKSEDNKTKIGFIVSKKVSKKAVERNKIKRRLRASVRENKEMIKDGMNIIIIALPSIKEVPYSEINNDIKSILKI